MIIDASRLVASCGSSIGPVDDALAVNELSAMFSFPIGTKTALGPWVDRSCWKGAHRDSGPIGSFRLGIGAHLPYREGGVVGT